MRRPKRHWSKDVLVTVFVSLPSLDIWYFTFYLLVYLVACRSHLPPHKYWLPHSPTPSLTMPPKAVPKEKPAKGDEGECPDWSLLWCCLQCSGGGRSAAYFVGSGIHQLISQLVTQYLKSVSEEKRLSLPQLISRSIDPTPVVCPLKASLLLISRPKILFHFFLERSCSSPRSSDFTSFPSFPQLLLTTTDASADVAANLKGKVPKPMAQKIMLTLAGESATSISRQWADQSEKGTLTKKDYGKQTIFVYNQVSYREPGWFGRADV